MKRFSLIVTAFLFVFNVMSQQDYFVFIQETSKQPFYVRMGEVSHSSSATGHIILSKLRDSAYNFFIGFPRGKSAEQLFTITINKKDHGYELKNTNGRWQLFDLQTLQLIDPATSAQMSGQTVMRSDSYSELMAGVVDDSSVLYSAVEDTLATDTVKIKEQVEAQKDSLQRKNEEAIDTNTAVAEPPQQVDSVKSAPKNKTNVAIEAPIKDSTTVKTNPPPATTTTSGRDKRDIVRLIMENVEEGKMMIYVDRSEPVNDTIRIIIPRR